MEYRLISYLQMKNAERFIEMLTSDDMQQGAFIDKVYIRKLCSTFLLAAGAQY